MTEGDKTRLTAWGHEMRAVHDRLREALRLTREAVSDGREPDRATRELLLFCRGLCTALSGHHEGEDRVLFPAITAKHPELGETLRYLTQDHSMIAHLLGALEAAVEQAAAPEILGRHLDGVAAIMESHFRYEERELLTILERLELDATSHQAFGPL